MRKLHSFIFQRPSGQVLLATLLFCFIFLALFIGLFKAGSAYVQKEKALRGADLTALSVGAVYANGLQLVRYTNVALMVSAIADLVTLASSDGTVDPHLRNVVQDMQMGIFGINKNGDGPGLGLYPLFMWAEGAKLAEANQLRNNWPHPPKELLPALPPLPIFLFNAETSDLKWLLVPNMSLRFRTAADLLPHFQQGNVEDEKVYYYNMDRSSGQTIFYSQDEVEVAPNSKNQGQMRVKGKGKKFVAVVPVITPGARNSKDKNSLTGALSTLRDLLKHIQLDVTHADFPHNHTVIIYDQLPSHVKKNGSDENLDFHGVSEMKLVGGGLAAWDLAEPNFRVRLISIDLLRFPKIRDLAASVSGLPSLPSIPNVQQILHEILHMPPTIPSTGDNPSQNLGFPTVPSSPNLPNSPGLPGIPSLSDVEKFFNIDPSSLPQVPNTNI